jgi:hypothetical protein
MKGEKMSGGSITKENSKFSKDRPKIKSKEYLSNV